MNRYIWVGFLAFVYALSGFPSYMFAENIDVPSGNFPTLSSALNRAANTDEADIITLLKDGSPFPSPIALVPNITLQGEKGYQIIIEGKGINTEPVITAAQNTTIQRLTLDGGQTGISITGQADNVKVRNVIISGQNADGIRCDNVNNPELTNNTLDGNGTGITCLNGTGVTIQHNIVSNNTTDFNLDNPTINNAGPNIDFNNFFNNVNDDYVDQYVLEAGVIQTNDILDDPLFVDRNQLDFHLKSGSKAIRVESDPLDDIGAYGGSGADFRLFPVSGLSVTGETSDGFTLSWGANGDYRVEGYKILYHSDSSSVREGLAVCPGAVTTHTLSGLTGSPVSKPPPPSNFGAGVDDGELRLSWSRVDQITVAEYRIEYGTVSGTYDSSLTVPGRRTETARISNLTNGQEYFLIISTVAKPIVFVAVTALDIPPPSPCTTSQNGIESHVFEERLAEAFLEGSDTSSDPSAEISATPEPPVRFPDLENEGACLIGNLASGSPLENHLRTLRVFRDHYLLKSKWGNRFTQWYYRTSPAAIQWAGNHEGAKAPARIVLYLISVAISMWMWNPMSWTLLLVSVPGFLFLKRRWKGKVVFEAGGGR